MIMKRALTFAPVNLKTLHLVPFSNTIELGGFLQQINVKLGVCGFKRTLRN